MIPQRNISLIANELAASAFSFPQSGRSACCGESILDGIENCQTYGRTVIDQLNVVAEPRFALFLNQNRQELVCKRM